jgi:nucleotide-binding universal stress UspA family protein
VSRIQDVLVGADFSGDSLRAVERGLLIAQASQARCTVLHALGLDPVMALREILGRDTDEVTQQILEATQHRLDEFVANALGSEAAGVESMVTSGRASVALAEFSADHDCDLLVLGHNGESGFRHLIFGSTAARALRQSQIPVLIVKNEVREPYKKILIAVDFSPTSKALVEMSRHLAPEATIHLIHVCSDAMEAQMRYASVNDAVIGQYRTSVERKANKQLVELAEKCGLSTDDYTKSVSHGVPGHQIVEQEEVFDPDLIMMGKHGTHASEDFLLGSVTKKVLEMTQTDVFVMVDKRQPGISE